MIKEWQGRLCVSFRDLLYTVILLSNVIESMTAMECVECVHLVQWCLPACMAVGDIFILLFLFLPDLSILK